MSRHAKIICTLGPSTNTAERIIMLPGMPLTSHGPTNTIKVHTIH